MIFPDTLRHRCQEHDTLWHFTFPNTSRSDLRFVECRGIPQSRKFHEIAHFTQCIFFERHLLILKTAVKFILYSTVRPQTLGWKNKQHLKTGNKNDMTLVLKTMVIERSVMSLKEGVRNNCNMKSNFVFLRLVYDQNKPHALLIPWIQKPVIW